MFLQALSIIALFFFILRNKFDFLLLFFCSLVLYNWQIIYGTIWVPPYTFEASIESKLIIFVVLSVLIFFTLINDYKSKGIQELEYNKKKEVDELPFFVILTIFSYIATIYAAYKGSAFIFSGKSDFLRSSGISYYFITYFPAAMSFIFFLISKRYKHAFFAFLPLLFYLIIGYRAALVTTVAFGFFVILYNKKILTLHTLKPVLLILMIFSFLAIYKIAYMSLKIGDLSILATMIEKDARFDQYLDLFLYAFFSAEFGQAASNLSLSASMDLSDKYSFANTLIGAIPFMDPISNITNQGSRFSTIIEAYANPGFSYGLGGSIWGEIYQAGGLSGVFLFSVLIIFILFSYNLSFIRSKERFVLFSYFIAFLAFYVHRNDFVLFIAYIKNIIFLTGLAFAVLWLVKNKVSLNLFSK